MNNHKLLILVLVGWLTTSFAPPYPITYIWGYQKTLKIAEVTNAPHHQCAYTSFEEDGKGGWSYTAPPIQNEAYTGDSHLGTLAGQVHEVSKGFLTPTVSYKVSFWAKGSGSVKVLKVGNAVQAEFSNLSTQEWRYYETVVSSSSVVLIDLIGNTYLDELRLHPVDAQMVTYTYNVLSGITSECDVNSHATIYEYDEFYRLKAIRDHQRNIIKTYHYFYKD
ncbi:MAG: hypothetical protein AAF734_05665 [Bacteroidota bacterium]